MKKGIGIVIFIVIVIISLGLSIYLPNKDKINDEAEDKSVIYSVIEENGKYGYNMSRYFKWRWQNSSL